MEPEANKGTCEEVVKEHPAEGIWPLQTMVVSSIVEVWATGRPFPSELLKDVFYYPKRRKTHSAEAVFQINENYVCQMSQDQVTRKGKGQWSVNVSGKKMNSRVTIQSANVTENSRQKRPF